MSQLGGKEVLHSLSGACRVGSTNVTCKCSEYNWREVMTRDTDLGAVSTEEISEALRLNKL